MARNLSFKTVTFSPALIEYSVSTRLPQSSATGLIATSAFYLIKLATVLLNGYAIYGYRAIKNVWAIWLMGIVSLFILLLRQNTYETLLVSEGFGIQVTSCGRFYFFSDQTRFIALHDILDIVIQEAFIGFEVRHVLLIVIAGEEKLQVVFPRLLPRLGVIEEVWRGARRCLCESSDDLPLTNGLVDKPTAVLTER